MKLIHAIAVGTLVLATAFAFSHAHARGGHFDYWNGSGASVNHHYFKGLTPYDNGGDGPDTGATHGVDAPSNYEVQKAIRDQRICAPVKLYLDSGVVYQHADGCRK